MRADRDRGLAGERARPQPQVGGAHLGPQPGHLIDELQRCPDRSLGVVLVGDRRAPHDHDDVPDELLDRPAVADDHLPGGVELAGEKLADLFGVAVL